MMVARLVLQYRKNVSLKQLMWEETALDLFARRATPSFWTRVNFIDAATTRKDGRESGYQPRHVIEICGTNVTPKAQILEHVVASFITKSCASSDQQPKERVFIFDHECEVSARRLAAIVARRLAGSERKEAVEEALKRIQICYCRDSFQWLATLNHIHFQLLDEVPVPLMLVFNCIGSFHAIDKMTAKSVGDGLALSEQVYIFLKQFIRHHSPIVFAAKEITKNTQNSWESAEYLPSSWTSQVSKRIMLRMPPPKPHHSCEVEKTGRTGEGNSGSGCVSFEAKCIVAGESRVYVCRIEGDAICSNAVRKTELSMK